VAVTELLLAWLWAVPVLVRVAHDPDASPSVVVAQLLWPIIMTGYVLCLLLDLLFSRPDPEENP